jgi:hypothetical protein
MTQGFMHDFLAGYAFNMIERNLIWKEYMEVEVVEEYMGRGSS